MRIFMTLTLLLLFSSSVHSETVTIIPGSGIAGARLGMTQDEVIRKLGKPSRVSPPAGEIKEVRLTYQRGEKAEETLNVDFLNNRAVRFVCNDPHYTLQGVRVSCDKADVEKIPAFAKNDGSSLWHFTQLGVRFCFSGRGSRGLPRYGSGKLETIIVFPVGKTQI